MSRFTCKLALAITLACVGGAASAQTLFSGTLSGAQETMPNTSPATGFGLITLSADLNSFTTTLTWSGMTAPSFIGHIHCCAALGANGPVAIDLFPPLATAASIFRSYDLTDISIYGGGFLAANGGTAESARLAFVAGLQSGGAYFNLHSSNFPAGEIRGQIAGAVPEAATWAMMIVGFGLVGGALRQRRKLAAA